MRLRRIVPRIPADKNHVQDAHDYVVVRVKNHAQDARDYVVVRVKNHAQDARDYMAPDRV